MIITPGVFAVVESSFYCDNDLGSEMFRPILKEQSIGDNGSPCRKFYLADCETIVATACVIPDIGHAHVTRYLEMQPKKMWRDCFIRWLEEPHTEQMKDMVEREGKVEYKLEEEYKTVIKRRKAVIKSENTKKRKRTKQTRANVDGNTQKRNRKST
jgi:hypothetical protein